MKMTEEFIQERLRVYAQDHRYLIGNSFIFDWESDFFSVTKSHYSIEYEIKISKADFKKDVEKRKHFLFCNCNKGVFIERGKTYAHDENYIGPNGYYEGKGSRAQMTYAAYSAVMWHDTNKFDIPNQFYYACPAGLLSTYDVPAYAGLLHVHPQKIMTIKKAPFLHKRKMILEDPRFIRSLLEKFYWMSHDQQKELKRNGIKFRGRTNVYAK
jgi:hypothetical protein